MTRRASWKGRLKFRNLSCEVGLYAALSSTEKISFNIINRKTGHRVERQFVDSETGKPVEREDQIKGYALDDGDYITIEGDELAALMPDNDKTITLKRFLPLDAVDTLYFDRPYHLAPVEAHDGETLAALARALSEDRMAAVGEAILFRRNRTLLLRAHEETLIATTLNFDYEVRSAKTAFKSVPEVAMDDEMLELAGHIIAVKSGRFDPHAYSDRYNDALNELVQAKIAGKALPKRKPEKRENIVDLKEALRRSVAEGGKGTSAKRGSTKGASKAGAAPRRAARRAEP